MGRENSPGIPMFHEIEARGTPLYESELLQKHDPRRKFDVAVGGSSDNGVPPVPV
jgi:hypothetical protein